ncbi:MAG: histidine kinase N-terminal 7TM domain-containing protein [Candidatus Buchananbacteria bacterium]
MSYINLGLIFIAGLNLGLAIFIFLLNPKNKINLSLSLGIFFLAAWTLGMAMFREAGTERMAWFWSYVQNASGAFIVIPFYFFSVYFPHQGQSIKTRNIFLVFLSALVMFCVVVVPGFWVKKIYLIPSNNQYDLNAIGVLYFNLHFFCYLLLSFRNLLKKYLVSSGFAKRQIFVTLIATSIIAIFGSVFSALIPLIFLQLGPYWLGPYFSLPMLIILVRFVYTNN